MRLRLDPAYLPEGRYWFRLRSIAHATATWGPVEVRDAEAPLRLRPDLVKGLALTGAVVVPASVREHFEGVGLHLFQERERGTWERVEEKFAIVEDGRYAFRGLDPGRYRISPGEGGASVLAEIELLEDDRELTLHLGPREDPANGR